MPSPYWYKGFVGFGCSFGGKFFGGYARGCKNRNYAQAAKNGILRKVRSLDASAVKFSCTDYRKLNPTNLFIYCDPPYEGTTGYSNSGFSSTEFWSVMRTWSKSNTVVISEYQAPRDFSVIACFNSRTDLRGVCGYKPTVEKLFRLGD